jgi:sporulation and spore germination protein/immunoglobulin-like protein involved in spore germination
MITIAKPIRTVLAVLLVATAVVGCSPSGTLGTVPPEASPAPSVGPPDLTPQPSTGAAVTPSPSALPSTSPSGSPAATPRPTPAAGDTMLVRAYYIQGGGVGVEGLVPTLREVPLTTGVARAAMTALLDDGPTTTAYPQLSTAIPTGARLLGLAVREGVATVDLSRAFESGGGSASMSHRLGQVVYTLTQFATVKSVAFKIEGKPVTTFGSEGIDIGRPQTRFDYERLLPDIFVDRPAFGAAIGNPARVTGNADVFEATFRIAILDGSRKTLVDSQAMATCGSGCRGTFDATLRYDLARAQWGTLRVYYGSAKDGSPQAVRDYPVWLATP